MSKRKKRAWISLVVVAGLLVVVFCGFYIYTLDYYRADEAAVQVFATEGNIEDAGDTIVIRPAVERDQKTGVIFYPGGKVEATAYVPFLEKLAGEGITCVLVKMPFNLAVFNVNGADKVYDEYPDIERWVLAGHSLGGAMASSYAGSHEGKLSGLILLGAYPVNDADIRTLAIYGSEDIKLDLTKLEGTENKLEIAGGNHAYFGNYGEQKGDGTATISREQQQEQAVAAIMEFIQQGGK